MMKKLNNKQCGAAVLATSMVLLFGMTLTSLFTAKNSITEQRMNANNYRSEQAFEASEAGMEFAIAYLKENRSTIVVDSNSDGYIDSYSDSNTANVTLANGSVYTITYSNPTAYDFGEILLTVASSNDDGTAAETVQQLIAVKSKLVNQPPAPITTKDKVDLKNDVVVTNNFGIYSIWSADDVDINNSAYTETTAASPASDKNNSNVDVQQNDTNLNTATNDQLFQSFFGDTKTTVEADADYVYGSLGNYNGVLNGKENVLIWINKPGSTVAVSGNTVVGSPEKPVILIINGKFELRNDAKIYGFVYVMDKVDDLKNSSEIHGAIVSENEIKMKNSFHLYFDTDVLSNVQELVGDYIKVQGSWNDLT